MAGDRPCPNVWVFVQLAWMDVQSTWIISLHTAVTKRSGPGFPRPLLEKERGYRLGRESLAHEGQ
jgi:hypothetical protein